MVKTVTVADLDGMKSIISSAATEYAKGLRGHKYCDIRLEASEAKACVAENGGEKASGEDYEFSLSVRVLAGSGAVASGYCGRILGADDADDLAAIVREGVLHAHRRALANAQRKALARGRFGRLGASFQDSYLSTIPVLRDVLKAQYKLDPREVPLSQVVGYVGQVSKALAGVSSQVVYSAVSASTSVIRELFASSQGSVIDQSYARSEGFVFVVSKGPEGTVELYDFTGHQRGWEVITEGFQEGGYISLPDLMTFAKELAQTTVDVSNAPALKPTENEVVVVTDPHFNALVCHEVIGHPSELDRALKMETAYAGRSWLFKDLNDNQLGKQVASPLVTAFSDPTMEGFGHYMYDHEGTPARRVYNIEKGIYKEFLNSRETANILGVSPNGHYLASDAAYIPLIRMSNTAFAPGDRDPQGIIKEVERGYYVAGHRIPSVAESRENFRISAMKVYEIRNGELGQLYRNGALMADSRDYFMRIDAVGSDFRLFPIPNCGKGQPMQAKRMGNGGPTMRSIARLTGGA